MSLDPEAPRSGLPDYVLQPLLTRITNASLDEDYEHVAARRALHREPEGSPNRHRVTALFVAIFGLLIVVAVVQTSRDAATTEEGRQVVIRQIGIAEADLAAKQRTVGELRTENENLAERLDDLSAEERRLTDEVDDLRLSSGYAGASGEGVVAELDDAASGSRDGVVRDEDLAMLVAGLWQAGAEAIAVNGQRLTPITGIRTVNTAIHVKTHPLRPPYRVEAIGNRDTLQSRFAESSAGSTFLGLRNAFGFEFEIRNDDSLDLPGRARPQLRSAQPFVPTPETRETLP